MSPGTTSRWTATPYAFAVADQLARELGLSQAMAAILVRRGCGTVAQARELLSAEERHDPLRFPAMRSACRMILAHVRRGSRILVHGDYDVDGVCSTAILVRALRALGASPSWHLPSRFDEGYGLSGATVERLAARGTDLLITADCAITAVDEVREARARGIDVVVTDHHRPGDRLPDCPIVHPALGPGAPEVSGEGAAARSGAGYPFPDLCAAGVASKLSEALYAESGRDPTLAEEDADLVCLATICDLVPLRGENRRLVSEGLRALARTAKPGLRALMRVAALEPGRVDEQGVGFRLGPRLNAAGRLERADAALELLLTDDEARAAEVADELDLLNRERRDQEQRILWQAESACVEQLSAAAMVIAGEGWASGVIGIVASRLVERHRRPCIVIALDDGRGTEQSCTSAGCRGSGRSIPAYDLHAGLAACAEHLTRFGGHRAAAGVELQADSLAPFRRAFQAHAAAALSPGDLLAEQRIDAVVPGGALGLDLAEELERLRPFGAGNPAPTLVVPAARLGHATAMGEERRHARFTLQSGGARARGVAFDTSASWLAAAGAEPHDAAVRLELNEWNGTVEPRLVLRALCPTSRASCGVVGEPGDPRGFWEAVERDLRADPSSWCAPPGPPRREVRDRRGEGFAGIAGDLISSGERVLVVCADVPRRRAGFESLIAGLASRAGAGAAATPAIASWDAIAARPELAQSFDHLAALDPPPLPGGEALLAAASGPRGERAAYVHLAWGPQDARFALDVAAAGLSLRPALADAYRALRTAGETRADVPEAGVAVAGDALRDALRGGGRHPRGAAACARLIRVLAELELLDYTSLASGGPACTVIDRPHTELRQSAAYRAYEERLAAVEGYLARESAGARPTASAETGAPAARGFQAAPAS